MSDRPEHLNSPVHREWPLAALGVGIFALAFWIDAGWWSYMLYITGAVLLGVSSFLGFVAQQAAWENARAELARGERVYFWQAALRWIRGRAK